MTNIKTITKVKRQTNKQTSKNTNKQIAKKVQITIKTRVIIYVHLEKS